MAQNHQYLLASLLHSLIVLTLFTLASVANADTNIYLVLLRDPPVVHYDASSMVDVPGGLYMPGQQQTPEDYGSYLIRSHDSLLRRSLSRGTYQKLYSYNYLINGFAVSISSQQADILSRMPEVVLVEKDYGVKKQTTYTPTYLGLPAGAWEEEGGATHAGEGIVIGIIDTGIDPTHPSFSDQTSNPYANATRYTGSCEVAAEFPKGSCNKKLVGARHFAAAAIASGIFNATIDFASPLDGDGHGTHTSSTAAGNNGVPVIVAGTNFGFASGIAPRAHVAMYKALYRSFGGFMSDVVAAIEQAVQDGVDILSLSIGPNGPPSGLATFFGIFDLALLSAAKAGVFAAQAAGNAGPYPETILSFSPWICSIAAGVHDRTYPNSIILGNNETIMGVGLAPATPGTGMYTLVLANDALENGSGDLSNADECQNSSFFEKSEVKGRVLVCTYTSSFLFGAASIQNVIATAQNLSAVGLVMLISPELDGQSLGAIPFSVPAIVIPALNDSMAVQKYYNSSSNFTASARILGGTNAKFSHQAPQVASFSSRGPDPATNDLQAADILKPNVMAPGSMIWAGWSPIGIDDADFQGEKFAMISGTSMATPHIAGIAALIKQKNPKLSPAAIASALATTASIVDKNGNPLLANNPSYNVSADIGPATPFDFGGGAVNATAALNPGLVFDAGFNEYVNFLCSIPGSAALVQNTTGAECGSSTGLPTDLNLPSITVANLTEARSIPREVTNVASATETYTVKITEPKGVTVTINPTQFTIATNKSQQLMVSMIPTETSGDASFGSILFSGSEGHSVRIPISVVSKSKSTRDWSSYM